MDAGKRTVKELFQKDIRYVIPAFQRSYVWDQEDQWDPLWEDIRNITENYLDALELSGDATKAEATVGTHFLGAVVLQQIPTPSSDIERRDVIDGQQRMTTLQILLNAAQEAMEEAGHTKEAKRMAKLVLNDEDFTEGDNRFKLWPTTTDQAPFRCAMTNGLVEDEHQDSKVCRAHAYFREQLAHWLADGYGGTQEKKAHGLTTALCGLLEIVVIDLKTTDDAYVIFETLNARGIPLLASDLVKNFILQSSSSKNKESIWSSFETEWWGEEVRQGRIKRPRIDVFLNYWLIARTGREITSQQVFPEFKKYFVDTGIDIESVVDDIQNMGATYVALDKFLEHSSDELFMYRWKVLQAGVLTPVLLMLFGAAEDVLPNSDRCKAVAAIESYLIRRMLCRMTTKDYNKLFLELGVQLENNISEAGNLIPVFLAAQTADSRLWPNDRVLRRALKELPLYRMLTRGRLRLLLEGIEDALRTGKAEERNCPRKLTIEHILPQKWSTHWPIVEEDPVLLSEKTENRNHLLHTLGNLTLLNSRLNPSLSNSAWSSKKEALAEHSTLFLNKKLLATYSGTIFQENEIAERGRTLSDVVCQIWPAPMKAE